MCHTHQMIRWWGRAQMRKRGCGVLWRLSDFEVRRLDGRQKHFQASLDYWAPVFFFPLLPPCYCCCLTTERASQKTVTHWELGDFYTADVPIAKTQHPQWRRPLTNACWLTSLSNFCMLGRLPALHHGLVDSGLSQWCTGLLSWGTGS